MDLFFERLPLRARDQMRRSTCDSHCGNLLEKRSTNFPRGLYIEDAAFQTLLMSSPTDVFFELALAKLYSSETRKILT